MTSSSVLYRPSLLELARAGNFRAISYWINSLLAPYGVYIQTATTQSGCLDILVDFQQVAPREQYLSIRKHLVRFICYRLWTLNSAVIRDVRIAARCPSELTLLWKQSVRINTPANQRRSQVQAMYTLTRRSVAWMQFQILRSIVVGRITFAAFFLSYWLLYWELSGSLVAESSSQAGYPSPVVPAVIQQSTPSAATQNLLPNQIQNPVAPQPPQEGILSGRLIQTSANQLQRAKSLIVTAPKQFQGQIVYHAQMAETEKVVALTFDDGPWPTTTEQVLDILKQEQIKATFFWVGLHIQRHPDLARKVAADGHAIGNHTWRHPLHKLDTSTAAQELGNTTRLIYETTGVKTSLMRPPGGNLMGQLVPLAQKDNYTVTMWSVDSHDYYVSTPLIIDNVLSKVRPGAIVLLHDGGGDRAATVQALPQIISSLKKRGYRFVTVPELLEMQTQKQVAGNF